MAAEPDFCRDILETRIKGILKEHLKISRDISFLQVRQLLCLLRFVIPAEWPCMQVKRIDSAPEVSGARPCIVSFAAWKDKENVLRQAKLLKGCGIYITEDVSHKNGQCWLSGYTKRGTKSGSCRACSLVPGSCLGDLEERPGWGRRTVLCVVFCLRVTASHTLW